MKIFDQVKNFLAKYYILYRIRQKKHSQSGFKSFYQNSKSVLIVFPVAKINSKEALGILSEVVESKSDVAVLVDAKNAAEIITSKKVNIISYDEKDRNLLNLPNQAFKSKLKVKKYDLVIDLNLVPDYYSLICIKILNAAWRVGFYDIFTGKIFNVQIKKSYPEAKISYKNLLNCLSMF